MLRNPFKKEKEVVVNENVDGEAKAGTTKDGQKDPVENTESVPQNPSKEIETTKATNKVAKKADKARTKKEKEFSNESNPNQKARTASTRNEEFDQDGNLRTTGYSYGVAPDDTKGTVFEEQNEGNAPESAKSTDQVANVRPDVEDYINESTDNEEEMSQKRQKKLEKELSDEENGISARVITSTGSYLKVKFYRNNKPFAIYKTRKQFSKREVKKFLKEQVEAQGF